jgi:hypothetical protein
MHKLKKYIIQFKFCNHNSNLLWDSEKAPTLVINLRSKKLVPLQQSERGLRGRHTLQSYEIPFDPPGLHPRMDI